VDSDLCVYFLFTCSFQLTYLAVCHKTECVSSRNASVAIGVTSADFEDCNSLEDGIQLYQKVYRLSTRMSPDKGGDAAVLGEVRTSFEELRDACICWRKCALLCDRASCGEGPTYETTYKDSQTCRLSWSSFYTAAEEDVPISRRGGQVGFAASGDKKGKAKKVR
jgi:hypothetical protein